MATPSAVPLIIRYLLLIQFMLPAFVVAKFHLGTILGPVKPKKFFSDFAPDQMISILGLPKSQNTSDF